MVKLLGHENELAEIGCDSIQACLLIGKATKSRAGIAERAKNYRTFLRIKRLLLAGQRGSFDAVEGRICTAASEDVEQYKEKVDKIIFWKQSKQIDRSLEYDELQRSSRDFSARIQKEIDGATWKDCLLRRVVEVCRPH